MKPNRKLSLGGPEYSGRVLALREADLVHSSGTTSCNSQMQSQSNQPLSIMGMAHHHHTQKKKVPRLLQRFYIGMEEREFK